jgi:hypothetical protein
MIVVGLFVAPVCKPCILLACGWMVRLHSENTYTLNHGKKSRDYRVLLLFQRPRLYSLSVEL